MVSCMARSLAYRVWGVWQSVLLLGLLSLVVACSGGGGGGSAVTPVPPMPPGVQLVSMEIGPQDTQIAKGLSHQFSATGIYSDGAKQDVSAQAQWQSGSESVASIDASGLARTLGVGTSVVTAQLAGITGSVTLTVTAASLVAVDVTPAQAALAKGTQQVFTATGVYSDNSTDDLTASVVWASSDAALASVSAAGQAQALSPGQLRITASLGAVSGQSVVDVSAAALVAMDVTPDQPSLAKGTVQQLRATGIYSDASAQDVTAAVIWTSSDSNIASVDTAGQVRAITQGQANLKATLGSVSAQTNLTVNAASLVSLVIDAASDKIAKGTELAFTVRGVFSDASQQDLTAQALWRSANPGVVSISNVGRENGLAVALAVGSSTITASVGSVSASTALEVSAASLLRIELTPPSPSLPKGTGTALTATGIYSDASVQNLTAVATWSSSAPKVVGVSNAALSEGRATALGLGSAVVSAAVGAVSGSTTVQVSAATLVALDVTPSVASVAKGTRQHWIATGVYSDQSVQDLSQYVTWRSSDERVLAISSALGSHGLGTALDQGDVRITAQLGAVSASASLKVTAAQLVSIVVAPVVPGPASLAKGTYLWFSATGVYTDNSTQDVGNAAKWLADSLRVFKVTDGAAEIGAGRVYANGVGSEELRVSYQGVTGTTLITVTPAVLASIDVAPNALQLAQGLSQPYTANGVYSDKTRQDLTDAVTWSSSSTAVATISNAAPGRGLLKAGTQGSTNISAALGSISGATSLTVTPATLASLALSIPTSSLANGVSERIEATGLFTDGTVQNLSEQVSWSVSNTQVLSVSNAVYQRGLVTGLKEGTASVTASMGSVNVSAPLQVTPALLASLHITPSLSSMAQGEGVFFKATGIYTDRTTQDLTLQTNWISTDPEVLYIVSSGNYPSGSSLAKNPGSIILRASIGNVSASLPITVTPPVVRLILFQSQQLETSMVSNTNQAFTVRSYLTAGAGKDVTNAVTYASSDPSVATVIRGANGKRLISAKSPGKTTLTATITVPGRNDISTTIDIQVIAATPVSLQVVPSTPLSLKKAASRRLTAVATFSDGSLHEVSSQVFWKIADAGIAKITQPGTADAGGLLTALAAGNTSLSASFNNVTSPSINLAVTPAALVSIAVTPVDPLTYGFPLPFGSTRLTATGTYSDASTEDLTPAVTWSTDDSFVSVSNDSGTQGWVDSRSGDPFHCHRVNARATLQGAQGSTLLRIPGLFSPC
jgi:trimeric autotransporter adhesin